MLYASNLFKFLQENKKLDIEDNPDEIPELVARVLCHHIEHRLQRNLTYGYRSRQAVLNRVRGRIDLLSTERQRLLDRGKVACRFDELTTNTPRNRYVKAALLEISRLVSCKKLAHRCRVLAIGLTRMGVIGQQPVRGQISINRVGRHESVDLPMLAAAHLALNLALPTETYGTRHLPLPDRNSALGWKLFEKGIAGFYGVVLFKRGWHVSAGDFINWRFEFKSKGISNYFPKMKTDIILDHRERGDRVVVDTKFKSITMHDRFGRETLRSADIYQIYAYLRSQEENDDLLAKNASGLLLHPSVGETFDECVVIQRHKIRFATVDLRATAKEIRQQLLQVVDEY